MSPEQVALRDTFALDLIGDAFAPVKASLQSGLIPGAALGIALSRGGEAMAAVPFFRTSYELHTSLHRVEAIERPTMMVFDLDPGPGADVLDCAEVGLWLRDMFEQLGLRIFVKTSGSKGLHAQVPLNVDVTYDETKPFARAVAELLEKTHPDRVVSRMTKSLRENRVLVDWSQNDVHKTTVCAYSLRAKERPTVSTPVDWEEVEAAREAGDPGRLVFEAPAVLERIEERGDPLAEVLTLRQELPALGTGRGRPG